MAHYTLRQVSPTALEIKTDGWSLRLDAPATLGGAGDGASPTELLATALAGCKAMMALVWAKRQGIEISNLEVDYSYTMVDSPRRMGEIEMTFRDLLSAVPVELQPRLEGLMEACPVANTLKIPPTVKTTLL